MLFENGEAAGMEKGKAIGLEKGKVIGREEGVKQAFLVCKKVQDGETDNKRIAESIGCTLREVEMVRKQFGI